MIENPTPAEYETLLRQDFSTFAARCFYDLNPQTELAMNWHLEVIAAKLAAVRQGQIPRLIINLPPRHLKSLLASIAFPAWCLGHDPSAQILCVSYAQDLADKLARDCGVIRFVAAVKPRDEMSEAQPQAWNEWYDHTLYSRLNDKR